MREPCLDDRIFGPVTTRDRYPRHVVFQFHFRPASAERLRVASRVIGKSCWWEGSWWRATRTDVFRVDLGEPWTARLTIIEEKEPQPETFALPSLIEYLKAVEVGGD